jgi:ABC-type polysaccharide/polyol phosphate export permease
MLIRMVVPLLKYRRLIWQHAVADLRHRYAGTGLGVVWNVLHPLALILIYSVVFTVVLPAGDPRSRSIPYPLYLCAGLLPWLAFAECITRGTNAFCDNAAYLKKLPIPEQVFVAQTAASATLGLGISFSLLLVGSLLFGHRPTVWWLLLPLPLIALQALGFALGLLCGTLNVFFRDIGQLMTVALQVVLWTAPIVYVTPEHLPRVLALVFQWHPIMPALNAVRDLFLYGRAPSAGTWVGMVAWPALALGVAGMVFHKLRAEIRDVL